MKTKKKTICWKRVNKWKIVGRKLILLVYAL